MDGLTTEAESLAPVAALLAGAEVADEATPPPGNEEKGKPQSARLVELAADAAFFTTPGTEPFADIPNDGHRETYPLRDRRFKDWLSHLFYTAEKRTPSSNAMQDALSVLEGRARFEGATREVFVRVAHAGGRIYLDLGRPDWEAVEVRPDGWSVIVDPPVRFHRPRGLLPLPAPIVGGNLGELWAILNIHGDERALVLSWLVMLLHRRGPYPILILRGEQGSGKTSAAGVLKAILDPAKAALRAEPRDVRDLMIGAQNSRLLAYDNLSSIPAWLSDALCRLSTGGGFAVRELYADAAETLFEASRPVMINGISDVATRSDLIDRCIFVETKVIGEQARRTKTDLDAAFDAMHPRVLGALLTAAATALQNESTVRPGALPRMADFAVWASAAEPALGLAPGTVIGAFNRNRAEAHGIVLDASPVGVAVLRLAERHGTWKGTPDELLKALLAIADENARNAFPKNAKGLSDLLRRIAPNLRAVGVNAFRPERRGSARQWVVKQESGGDSATVATVATKPALSQGSSPVAEPSHAVAEPSQPSQPVAEAAACDGPQPNTGSGFPAMPSQPSHVSPSYSRPQGDEGEDL